jgi:hypothetical protein
MLEQYLKNGTGSISSTSIHWSINNVGAVQSVAAHELGHDIGLGHDPNENQLMYYSTDRWWVDGINTPRSDDNAGTNAIYTYC